MALETRGFTRPGRRTLLWAPADTRRQRLARWDGWPRSAARRGWPAGRAGELRTRPSA